MTTLRTLVEHTNLSYNEEAKAKFHRSAKLFLGKVAKCMGLEKGTYDVRSNQGGIACSGEVTLHCENVYVQISQYTSNLTILVRACEGRKDFTGGRNNWMPTAKLDSVEDFAHFCEMVAKKESFFVI